jgi:hypothetical protein
MRIGSFIIGGRLPPLIQKCRFSAELLDYKKTGSPRLL